MMKRNRSTIVAWVFYVFYAAWTITQFILWRPQVAVEPTFVRMVDQFIWNVVGPLVFAVLAVLIITRQPGNRVGWLMMIIALGGVVPVEIIDSMPAPPERLTPGLWLLLWYYGWGWIPTMFPIFLIPLHFPTGQPPSPRWHWVNFLALGMVVFFVFTGTFLNFETTNWTFPNPFGFIPNEFWNGPPLIFWFIGLLTLVISSVASLFLRYRKANQQVRLQIKWLLYACALFAVIYAGVMLLAINQLGDSSIDPLAKDWSQLVFSLSILVIPAAIGFSILRYRLYEIDIIIRRTLQYSLLTGLLSLVYFGGVALLQGILSADRGQLTAGEGAVSGPPSPVVIVVTTLLIAALFNPLRRRLQDFIDRCFYRQKYDAEKALAEFAAEARSETDITQLADHLTGTVQDTLQPKQISLWMQPKHIKQNPDR